MPKKKKKEIQLVKVRIGDLVQFRFAGDLKIGNIIEVKNGIIGNVTKGWSRGEAYPIDPKNIEKVLDRPGKKIIEKVEPKVEKTTPKKKVVKKNVVAKKKVAKKNVVAKKKVTKTIKKKTNKPRPLI